VHSRGENAGYAYVRADLCRNRIVYMYNYYYLFAIKHTHNHEIHMRKLQNRQYNKAFKLH